MDKGTYVKIEAVKPGSNVEFAGKVGTVEEVYDDGVHTVKVGKESVEATSVSFIAAPKPEPKAEPAKSEEPKAEEPQPEAVEAPVEAPVQTEEPAAEAVAAPVEEPKPEAKPKGRKKK